MSAGKIRVMVVEDQRLLREALERVLALEHDVHVTAGASDGQQAMELVDDERPDVVLMDIKMPRMDGITATRAIKKIAPGCRVLMMTVLGEQEYVQRAIIAGADGYLLKDAGREEVADAIRRVHRGESVIEPALLGQVIQRYRQMERKESLAGAQRHGLTARETEVLRLVAEGLTNDEIARSLNMAVGTVKTHLHRAFEKIGARDRTQAALFVVHHGL